MRNNRCRENASVGGKDFLQGLRLSSKTFGFILTTVIAAGLLQSLVLAQTAHHEPGDIFFPLSLESQFGLVTLDTPGPSSGQDSQHSKVLFKLQIHSSYGTAYRAARDLKKLLILCFVDPTRQQTPILWLQDNLASNTEACEIAVLSPDTTVRTKEGIITLLDDPGFSSLKDHGGVAIVSFLGGPQAPDFGRVVATLPFPADSVPDDTVSQDFRETLSQLLSRHMSPPPEGSRAGLPEQDSSDTGEGVKLAGHMAPLLGSEIWLTDYHQGVAQAKREKKMLLVYIYPEQNAELRDQFENVSLKDDAVLQELVRYVRVRVPESAELEENGEKTRFLKHPMLSEMEGEPGLFIVDYASEGQPYYGQVVSQFPFLDGKPYTRDQMLAILTLPPGTLTQRTMVYAVRVHPERPRSVLGQPDPYLFSEAEKHSEYQARIRRQGHHFWDSRFARIIRTLRGKSTASEVCAESWPGQGLLRAALECVRCWRLSPGHWRAVSSRHDAYGYDIKRGSNGVWYATGIFANR